MIRTRIVEVDLAMAEFYLSLEKKPEVGVQDTNRGRSWQIVLDYSRAMLTREWRLTHQGLAFVGSLDDGSARLGDGGHRMEAVRHAATVGFPDSDPALPPQPNIRISFMVTDGLTPEDMLAMDIGLKRTPGHFMTMHGEASAFMLAAITKLTWVYMNNLMDTYDGRRKTPMSPVQQRTHLAAYPDLRLAVAEGSRLSKVMTPSAVGAFWFLAVHTGYDEKDVAEFLEGVFCGEHMGKGDGRFMLRELMINSRKVHRTWETHEQLALIIKAFLKWTKNEEVLQLGFRVGEKFPKL